MASAAYLQIDGAKGESTDSGHQGWIEITVEITAARRGVTQPNNSSVSTAGGHTTGHPERRSLSFAKLVDIASPVLMQHCSTGNTIPKARIEFMRADGDGRRVKY